MNPLHVAIGIIAFAFTIVIIVAFVDNWKKEKQRAHDQLVAELNQQRVEKDAQKALDFATKKVPVDLEL